MSFPEGAVAEDHSTIKPNFALWARLKRITVARRGEGRLQREQPMTSTSSSTRSEFSQDRWRADLRRLAELVEEKPSVTDARDRGAAQHHRERTSISPTEPSSGANIGPAVLMSKPPSLPRRAARSSIIFCMGIAAALAWQSYGDAAREMIAGFYPQLGWLEPQTVGVGTLPEMTSRTAPATTSDSQDLLLKSILVNLAAVRQSVDQLAANQRQMASDIAKLKAAEPNVLGAISSAPPLLPAAAPAVEPVSVAPQSSQEPPVR